MVTFPCLAQACNHHLEGGPVVGALGALSFVVF
jgi:hypothetical protein